MKRQLQFLIYRSAGEDISVDAVIRDESIWLTQKAMSELFEVQTPAISKHLKNIFTEGELDETVVVSKMEITTAHGAMPEKTQTKEAQFYNLDAIISVGYRVNSRRATQFRIWETGVLKEYLIKGFVLDDERLKQGKTAFDYDEFGNKFHNSSFHPILFYGKFMFSSAREVTETRQREREMQRRIRAQRRQCYRSNTTPAVIKTAALTLVAVICSPNTTNAKSIATTGNAATTGATRLTSPNFSA